MTLVRIIAHSKKLKTLHSLNLGEVLKSCDIQVESQDLSDFFSHVWISTACARSLSTLPTCHEMRMDKDLRILDEETQTPLYIHVDTTGRGRIYAVYPTPLPPPILYNGTLDYGGTIPQEAAKVIEEIGQRKLVVCIPSLNAAPQLERLCKLLPRDYIHIIGIFLQQSFTPTVDLWIRQWIP